MRKEDRQEGKMGATRLPELCCSGSGAGQATRRQSKNGTGD